MLRKMLEYKNIQSLPVSAYLPKYEVFYLVVGPILRCVLAGECQLFTFIWLSDADKEFNITTF